MAYQRHSWRIEASVLGDLLRRFTALRIGLLGDLFLDRYLEIDPELEEVSIETGLAAHQVVEVRNAPGALGTVMNNLAALGAGGLTPLTIVGDDGHAFDLLRSLASLPLREAMILRSSQTLTPTYTKPLRREAGGARELQRLDVRDRRPRPEVEVRRLEHALAALFSACDGWIVLDQIPEPGRGVVCDSIRGVLAERLAADPRRPALIDSRAQLRTFRRGVLKGNRREFAEAWEVDPRTPIEDLLRRSHARTGDIVFCTDGPAGVWCADAAGRLHHVQGRPAPGPVDIVGAGDAFSSGAVLSLAAGADPPLAAQVGNLAASITVRKLGETGVASPEEMLQAIAS